MGSPVKADRTEEEDIGEVIGFASNMLVFFSKSRIYLHWERGDRT
jgi:hypothetical protein